MSLSKVSALIYLIIKKVQHQTLTKAINWKHGYCSVNVNRWFLLCFQINLHADYLETNCHMSHFFWIHFHIQANSTYSELLIIRPSD